MGLSGFLKKVGKVGISAATGGKYGAGKKLLKGDVKGAFGHHMAGGDVGNFVMNMGKDKPKDIKAPGISPEQTKLQEMRQKEAKAFKKQMPELQREQQSQAESASRSDLAERLSGIKENANSRGLLYSGLRASAESSAGASAASDLAAQKAAINSRLHGQQKALNEAALGGNLGIQGLISQRQDIALENDLAQKNARNQALSGLFSAGGTIGGAALGRK